MLKARTEMYTGGGTGFRLFLRRHADGLQKLITVALFYLVGVLYYSSVEDWTTADCFYFITVSITTVGYGVRMLHGANE